MVILFSCFGLGLRLDGLRVLRLIIGVVLLDGLLEVVVLMVIRMVTVSAVTVLLSFLGGEFRVGGRTSEKLVVSSGVSVGRNSWCSFDLRFLAVMHEGTCSYCCLCLWFIGDWIGG
jgi:hypothetical protein